MKKLLLLLVLVMLPLVASAHDIEVQNAEGVTIYYNYINDGTELAVTFRGEKYYAYSEYTGNVVIPKEVTYMNNTYKVTSIDERAFSHCSGLTSVTIGSSVTNIGCFAFNECTCLTSVTIGNSVTSIGDSAFYLCTGLTSVTIGNNVTNIDINAFAHCTSLTSVTIPNSVINIGAGVFYNCSNLTSVNIGNCVTSIGGSAFGECSGLTSVTIPNSVTSIGFSAFSGCSGLTSITIPNSVTSIGNNAFDGCSGLTSITIPNSVRSIGQNAFLNCTGLKKVIVPDIAAWCGINFRNNYANPLYYANHLYSDDNSEIKDLIIPNSVTSIGNSAFSGCSGLTSITIPNSVTSIGLSTFDGCKDLTTVTINSNTIVSQNYSYRNSFIYIFGTQVKEYIIGNEVQSIGQYAFYACSNLTSITIPNSVTSIGDNAFYACSNLTSITIPNGVTSIGNSAFYNCSGLTSVTIPNSVTSIGRGAFSGCTGLTSVTIPNSVTSIGRGAFSGCTGLTSITIPNSVTSIGDNAFYKCSGLISITIPNSVKSIDEATFAGCSGLTSIIIPNSVTSIGSSAFSDCSGLTSVTIGNKVKSIGSFAFYGCLGLTSITIPNSVTSIGQDAFLNCTVLKKVIVSDIVAWCGINFRNNYANPLYYANHLYSDDNSEIKNLIIPNSVTSIGNSAFSGCSGLTSVTIPNSVTSIGKYAFYGCSGLTSVNVLKNTPLTISSGTFPTTQTITLYVPRGSKAAYEAADIWKDFSSIVEFDEPFTLTANDLEMVYGDAMPEFTYNIEGGIFGGKPQIACEATSTSPVGTYPIVISQGTIDNDLGTYINGKLTVTKAPLTITAKSYTIKQGYALPTFEAEYSGFKNNETDAVLTKKPSITTTATSVSAPGIYEIVISGAEATNYDISYVKGTLTITQADLVTVTAKDYSREYGEANPTFEYTTAGATLTGTPEITCSATATSPVGEYDIVVSKGSITNYNVTLVNGKLTVTKAPLTITAKSYTIKQGEALPTFEAEYSGFKNNETDAVLTKKPSVTTTATSASEPGTYEIVVSGADATNYDITYVKGTLTIDGGINGIFYEFNGDEAIVVDNPSKYQGNVVIPASVNYNDKEYCVTGIGNKAFYGCSGLTSITIPNSMTSIGSLAFSGCSGLTSVEVYANTPPAAGSNAFPQTNITLYVPKGCKAAYEAADIWKDFSSIVEFEEPYEIRVNEDVQAKARKGTFSIDLKNETTDLTAYQFDLTLPDGISLSVNDKGKYVVTKTSRYEDDNQTLNITKLEGSSNTYRFVSFSMSNEVITGTSGAILNAALTVGESVEEGTYEATISDIVVTKTDGTQLKLNDSKFNIVVINIIKGDANGDGEVNVSDIVEIVNYIMNKPSDKFVFAAADLNGDGEVNVTDIVKVVSIIMSTGSNAPKRAAVAEMVNNDQLEMTSNDNQILSLNMQNEGSYVASQFDIVLSAGQTLESISLNSQRMENHLMTYAKTNDNRYRVVIYSLDNATYKGYSGELLDIKVAGSGEVSIEDILFITAGQMEKRFSPLRRGTTGVSVTTKQVERMDIYSVDGRLVRKQAEGTDGLEKGLYIINGKKQIVK